MKIAVTSKGKDLSSPVDPRFGRAAYILVVDTINFDFQVLDNDENVNAFTLYPAKRFTGTIHPP